MSSSELWKPKRSKLQERWKVFEFEVKKNWTPRGKLEPRNPTSVDEPGNLSDAATSRHQAIKESTEQGVCISEQISLCSSSSDTTEAELSMEEGQRELVWSKQASHEDDGLARDAPMVTREEPVTTREASEEPVVGTVEAVPVGTSSDIGRREEPAPIDELVLEVWQPKFVPRNLLDLNELDICLSVYNEAFMECLQSTQDATQQNVLLKHWKLTTKRVLSVISDDYITQRLKSKLEKERILHSHLQSDLVAATEEIRNALGSYYTVLQQAKEAQACMKKEEDRHDTEVMLKELRKLAMKYHI